MMNFNKKTSAVGAAALLLIAGSSLAAQPAPPIVLIYLGYEPAPPSEITGGLNLNLIGDSEVVVTEGQSVLVAFELANSIAQPVEVDLEAAVDPPLSAEVDEGSVIVPAGGEAPGLVELSAPEDLPSPLSGTLRIIAREHGEVVGELDIAVHAVRLPEPSLTIDAGRGVVSLGEKREVVVSLVNGGDLPLNGTLIIEVVGGEISSLGNLPEEALSRGIDIQGLGSGGKISYSFEVTVSRPTTVGAQLNYWVGGEQREEAASAALEVGYPRLEVRTWREAGGFSVTVSNSGNGTATGVILRLESSSPFELYSLSGVELVREGPGRYRVEIGNLDSGESFSASFAGSFSSNQRIDVEARWGIYGVGVGGESTAEIVVERAERPEFSAIPMIFVIAILALISLLGLWLRGRS